MSRLIIKNIGPVKDVDITFNKVNIIIGPQSSGKSTINKVACYCTWIEKKVSINQSFEYFLTGTNFIDNLVAFHKMKGYFRKGSYIEYTSKVIRFSYMYEEGASPVFEWVNQFDYKRTKISYIPAERNVVSLISGWDEVKLPNNNIFNFMKDWNTARKLFTPENKLPIDYINSSYYFDEETETDYLKVDDDNLIRLIDASSGQQSMVPLYMLMLYFTRHIYEKKEENTVKNSEIEDKLFNRLALHALQDLKNETGALNNETLPEFMKKGLFKEYKEGKVNFTEKGARFVELLAESSSNFLDTHFSSLFIEEPELNLFPSTQRKLLYFILHTIQEKEHRLFITTHSPYILYALNNCMMGALVRDKMPEEEVEELESHKAWILPDQVSAWQIENGRLVSILDERTHCIGKHYFNRIMNDTLDEYYQMLNYFTPEN